MFRPCRCKGARWLPVVWLVLLMWARSGFGGSALVAVETAVRAPVLQGRAGSAVREARTILQRARERHEAWQGLPEWDRVDVLESALDELNALLASGCGARAYERAVSRRFELQRDAVRHMVLNALPVPFLVIGPFGDPELTASVEAKTALSDKGVAALDHAFLSELRRDEAGEVNRGRLAAGFTPDLSATYSGYGKRDLAWEPAIKGEALDLTPWAADDGCWGIVYLFTEMWVPEQAKPAFLFGLENTRDVRIYVDDRAVCGFWSRGAIRDAVPGMRRRNFVADEGWHRVVFKVTARPGSRFYLRPVKGHGNRDRDTDFRVRFRCPVR